MNEETTDLTVEQMIETVSPVSQMGPLREPLLTQVETALLAAGSVLASWPSRTGQRAEPGSRLCLCSLFRTEAEVGEGIWSDCYF